MMRNGKAKTLGKRVSEMRSDRITSMIFLALGLIILVGCGEEPSRPQTGFISVSVTDRTSQEAVSDVEIDIAPIHRVLNTNEDGLAVFEVAPGDYFVDAKVCCSGPGWIDYHVPATVTAGDTSKVDLEACLSCL
jgi:hypothetical protein